MKPLVKETTQSLAALMLYAWEFKPTTDDILNREFTNRWVVVQIEINRREMKHRIPSAMG